MDAVEDQIVPSSNLYVMQVSKSLFLGFLDLVSRKFQANYTLLQRT